MTVVVWEHCGIKVIKQKSHSRGHRYTIWDDNENEQVVLYEDELLDMCHAVIQDAELESEE